jgi:DNA-binding transcriptional ArsR family regulator
MTALAQVFHALGDPVRLEMVQRLVAHQPRTIASLSEGFSISRQGARKHLQVLADASLVALEPRGREVHVHLEPEAIEGARAFLARLERDWDRRLDALRRSIEEP